MAVSNLWINWRVLWWRIQIGPDRPWVRLCWHRAVYTSRCVFCALDLEPEVRDGKIVHPTGTGMGDVLCGYYN